MNKFKQAAGLLLIMFAISGCAWIDSLFKDDVDPPERPTEELEAEKLLNKLKESNIQYDWINASTRIRIEHPEISTTLSSNLVLAHDSLIWGTASAAFNLEVLRFAITPDSIRIIDRYNRDYYSLPFEYIQLRIPAGDQLTFSDLQELIVGNYPFTDQENMKSGIDSVYYALYREQPNQNRKLYILPGIYKMAELNQSWPNRGEFMNIRYSNYKNPEDKQFPEEVEIHSTFGTEMMLRIEFRDVAFEKKDNINFEVPDNYERKH